MTTTNSESSAAMNSRRPALQVLDPCTLGRPIHLLNDFRLALWGDLTEFFSVEFNRRYGAAFELGEVSLTRGGPLDAASSRWLVHANAIGRIGFAIERCVLLAAVDCRYGESTGKPLAPIDESARPTATEERMALMLASRLAQVLAARVEASGRVDEADDSVSQGFTRVAPQRAAPGAWTIRAEVREPQMAVDGLLWFTLDEGWMARLLRKLAPRRERPSEATRRAEPLSVRLPLTLTGRLLQKELPLGELMDLRVGDVIPISLGATEVLIDDSRLFSASVAEHKGKLCLTSFEPLE